MDEDIQCPVDHIKVNENKIRVIALLVLLIAVALLLTGYNFLIIFLTFDFFVRAFNMQKLSLLGALAGIIVRLFKIPTKFTDRGPKRFAAGVGFVVSALILIAIIQGWLVLAGSLTIALCIFASLEAFAGICGGCYVYTALQKIRSVFSKA
jgi:hypothetical protein